MLFTIFCNVACASNTKSMNNSSNLKIGKNLKISDINEIQSFEYFYGLRLPAPSGDCGTPHDSERLRLQFNLQERTIREYDGRKPGENTKITQHSNLTNSQIDRIKSFLENLSFSEGLNPSHDQKEKGFLSEEILIQYSLDHKPFQKIFYVQLKNASDKTASSLPETSLEKTLLGLMSN
jgi:hypothetical protein